MKTEGRVGLISASDGTVNPLRTTAEGALVVASGGGKYTEATLQGRVFTIANQAAVAVTAAMATTYTGLAVENPTGSGKNLVMLQFGFAMSAAASAATVFGIMTGVDGGTLGVAGGLTPRNRFVGGDASVASADADCVFVGTPVLEQVVAQISTAATSVAGGAAGGPTVFDLDGSLVLTPGSYVAAYSTAAITAAPVFHFMWEEVDE